ncbi:MAG TPA: HD domain-containing phosphohydrolase [Phycisphaerae bacterium]|nr:HD domain-containing protein [Phycisphaerales bacterium]HRX87243.1 HD domain-containing phosphohydrolase [Phycisphaerae bacterium]
MPEPQDNACTLIDHVVGAVGCGALMVDAAGTIRCANQRLAGMAQVAVARLVGKPLSALVTPMTPAGRKTGSMLERTAPAQTEGTLARGSAPPLPVLIAHGPLPPELGAPTGHLLLLIDIAKQKEADERQHALLAEVSRFSDTVIEQALELKRYAQRLEERVRERTRELHEANIDAIFMLAVASEAKDADTGAHVLRIQRGSAGIARMLGLSEREAEEIGYSAILHDVGKMVVPDQILRKPGPLTPEERVIVEEHTLAGERILSTKPFFASARRIARSHHENWDGSGYPDRLVGEEIALEARIVHVADVFDALTNARVYKPAWPMEEALSFLREHRGRMFDPAVVRAFEAFLEASADMPVGE